MWSRISAPVLIVALWSCEDRAEIAETAAYVARIKKFHHYNQEIQNRIDYFDNPHLGAAEEEMESVRTLIEGYAREVNSLGKPEDPALRKIHGLYVRSLEEFLDPDHHRGEGPGQRCRAVAERLRQLRRNVRDLVHPGLRVLLARRNLEGSEYELRWPRQVLREAGEGG